MSRCLQPLSSAEKTSLTALALPCFTSPLLARPSLSFSIFSSQPCRARLLCFGESCSLCSPGCGWSHGTGPLRRRCVAAVACRSAVGKPRVLPAPGQSPVAEGKGKRSAQLIQSRQQVREGSKGGWFEIERRLGKGTAWLEGPEGCGNRCSVIPGLWKNPGCETLGNARTLLLRGICMP